MFSTHSMINSIGTGRMVRLLEFALTLLFWAVMLAILFARPAAAADLGILDQVRPALGDLVALVITALVAYAVQRFKAWTGIEIEAKHRQALQSALANAARIAVASGGRVGLEKAVDYVLTSVPDALAHFDADGPGRVRELLEPHIAQSLARSAG